MVQYLWKSYSEGPDVSKYMWFPKEWLVQRKQECMAELTARGSDEWVGTNDVLVAAYYKVHLTPVSGCLAYAIVRQCIQVATTKHQSTFSVLSICAACSPPTLPHTRISTKVSQTAPRSLAQLRSLAPSQSSRLPSPFAVQSTP